MKLAEDLIEGPGGEPLITPPAAAARMAADSSLLILQAHNGRFLGRVAAVSDGEASFEIVARILDGSALWDGSRGRPLKRDAETTTPAWAVGMERLGRGIYVDAEGALHLSDRELCAVLGIPCTPENAAMVERATLDAIRDRWPGASPKVEHRSD